MTCSELSVLLILSLHDGKLKVPISSSVFFSPVSYFTKHLFTVESCSHSIAVLLLNQLSAVTLQTLHFCQ